MPDTQFEAGVFLAYRATDQINIGAIDTTTAGGYNVSKDETLQYDGSTIILKDGREFSGITQLRSAIEAGWFVPETDTQTTYRPKSANIEVREVEQRGQERARKSAIQTEDQGEKTVGTVSARKKDREEKYEAVSRGLPPMSSDAGKSMAQTVASPMSNMFDMSNGQEWLKDMITFNENVAFTSGDSEMDALAIEISVQGNIWLREKLAEVAPDDDNEMGGIGEVHVENFQDKIENDIVSLFTTLDDVDEDEPHKKKLSSRKFETHENRISMPIKSGDEGENEGQVVAKVPTRTMVEEEQSISLNVAPATPTVEATTTPRLGASGVVVVDDQRNMGAISLSSEATQVDLNESAKVTPNTTGTVRMGDEAQVGGRRKTAAPQGAQDGVAVGRVLSPTHTEFTATDANTSSTAVERVAQGRTLKVEHFDAPNKVATGDVQEARTGESLEEILPDAASSSTPPAKVYLSPEDDPAYKAVREMIPDFEWDKERRWQDRVEDAMKHVENPPYLKGVIAVETETVAGEIKKRLASYLTKKAKKSTKRASKKTTKKTAKKAAKKTAKKSAKKTAKKPADAPDATAE